MSFSWFLEVRKVSRPLGVHEEDYRRLDGSCVEIMSIIKGPIMATYCCFLFAWIEICSTQWPKRAGLPEHKLSKSMALGYRAWSIYPFGPQPSSYLVRQSHRENHRQAPNAVQVEFSIRQIDNKTEAIDVHVLGHGNHGPGIPAHSGSAFVGSVVRTGSAISYYES